MMLVMDSLTDKVDWHKKIFDVEIVGKWRKEALEQPEEGLYFQATDSQGRKWAQIRHPTRSRIITEATFNFVRCQVSHALSDHVSLIYSFSALRN